MVLSGVGVLVQVVGVCMPSLFSRYPFVWGDVSNFGEKTIWWWMGNVSRGMREACGGNVPRLVESAMVDLLARLLGWW